MTVACQGISISITCGITGSGDRGYLVALQVLCGILELFDDHVVRAAAAVSDGCTFAPPECSAEIEFQPRSYTCSHSSLMTGGQLHRFLIPLDRKPSVTVPVLPS